MADVLVANIGALLAAFVTAIMHWSKYPRDTTDFRWVPAVTVTICVAIGLQYIILVVVQRPSSDRAEIVDVSNELSELADVMEYKLALAPLPDSAEFHYPSWDYHYNGGYSYVEGYSEVRLIRNMPNYQYKVRVHCSDPNTLYISLAEGYFDYTFATDQSAKGSVTSVGIKLDNTILLNAEKVPVIDDIATISASDIADRMSKGVLLSLDLEVRVDDLFEDSSYHRTIFVLQLFWWAWRECD